MFYILYLINQPIGSMYAIYGNTYHQYTPNVSIYTIHGSYGNKHNLAPNHLHPEAEPHLQRAISLGGAPGRECLGSKQERRVKVGWKHMKSNKQMWTLMTIYSIYIYYIIYIVCVYIYIIYIYIYMYNMKTNKQMWNLMNILYIYNISWNPTNEWGTLAQKASTKTISCARFVVVHQQVWHPKRMPFFFPHERNVKTRGACGPWEGRNWTSW